MDLRDEDEDEKMCCYIHHAPLRHSRESGNLVRIAFKWIQAFTYWYEAGLEKRGRSYQQSEFNLTRHAPETINKLRK